MNMDIDRSTDLLRQLIKDTVEPYLIWHAGKNAESVRAMATSVLCAMVERSPEEAQAIIPDFVVQLTGLIDDNSVVTRAYALRSLFSCGPIDVNSLKTLAFGKLTIFGRSLNYKLYLFILYI